MALWGQRAHSKAIYQNLADVKNLVPKKRSHKAFKKALNTSLP